MTIAAVIARLDTFLPGDEDDNIEQLGLCLEPLGAIMPAARLPVVQAMLGLIERFPDAEFGAPGPLVHEMEAIPGYEGLLVNSLQRQPEGLTVWMAHRILNSELASDARMRWLERLAQVTGHPDASESTKTLAAEFLQYQTT